VIAGSRIHNWLGLVGALLSLLFIYKWFGLAAFLLPPLFFGLGWQIAFKKSIFNMVKASQLSLFLLFWISLLLGYMLEISDGANSPLNFYAGGIGFYLAKVFNSFIRIGTPFVLGLSLIIFVIYFFGLKTLFGFGEELKDKVDGLTADSKPEEDESLQTEENEELIVE
jgi:S-DNA-T family DNA segregation ATPase FtsK/SpoIIIE